MITVTATVTTNQSTGTIKGVIVPRGNNPSIPQIKLGQQSNGTPALGATSKAVIAVGAQVLPAMSGIPESTSCDLVLVHTNAAGLDSNVITFPFNTIGALATATGVVLSAGSPSTTVGVPVTYTAQLNGTGSARFDPTKSLGAGVFSPTFLNLVDTNPQSFTYTPSVAGATAISGTNNAGLTNPAPISLSVSAVGSIQRLKGTLGWSYEQASYNSVDMPFTDIKAESSNWRLIDLVTGDAAGQPPMDSLGWPTSIPAGKHISTMFMRSVNEMAPYPTGDYLVVVQGCTLTWGGDAFLAAPAAGDAPDVQRVRVITTSAGGFEARITSLTGGPVRFVVCLPYVAANGIDPHTITRTTFNPEHLAKNVNTAVVRLMDRLVTNNVGYENDLALGSSGENGIFAPLTFAEWNTPIGAATYTCDDYDFLHNAGQGRTNLRWPLVVACAYCNQLQAIPWFNLPHQVVSHSSVPTANDAFTLAYANVVLANLDPTLPMYVEYSNEPWNPGFWQSNYIIQCGQLRPEGAIGYHAQIGEASRQVGDLFKSVLGNNRVVTVLSCQMSAAGAVPAAAIPHLIAKYGAGNLHLDAITIAPYIGDYYLTPEQAAAFIAPGTAARQNANDRNQFAYLSNIVSVHAAWANAYNLRLVGYEGGEGTTAKDTIGDQTAFIAANKTFQRDPTTRQLMIDYLNTVWKSNGGELFCYYLQNGHVDRSGPWGAEESIRQIRANVPKYDGIMAWADTNQIPYWTGQLPAELLLPGSRYIVSDGFIPSVRTTQRTGTLTCTVVPHGNYSGLTEAQKMSRILAGTNASGGAALYHEVRAASGTGVDLLFNAAPLTGLTPDTEFDAWFAQDNGFGGISTPVASIVRTKVIGTGVVLQFGNDNQPNGTAGVTDTSIYAKEVEYINEIPNPFEGVMSYTNATAPVGMSTSIHFDSVGVARFQPNNDFAFPGDFMITFAILAGSPNYRYIWDMRAVASNPLLSCETNEIGQIVIKKGTSVLIVGTVPLGADTWKVFQLVRIGSLITLWGGPPGGAIVNLGSIIDGTSFGRAAFQFGKDIAFSGGFSGYTACVEIQKNTTIGAGAMPVLPLGGATPPTPTGDVVEFLFFNEQSTDIFGQTFIDGSTRGFSLTPIGTTGRPSWDNTYYPVYSSGFNSSVIFGSAGAKMGAATLSHLALGTDDFCFRGWLNVTEVGASLTCALYDGRSIGGGGQVTPVIYMWLNELRLHVNGLDVMLGGAPLANGGHFFAIARVAGVTRMFIDGIQVGSSYTDTNDYIAPAYPTIGDMSAGGGTLLGSMACFELVRNPTTVATGKYVSNFTPPALPFGAAPPSSGATIELQILNEQGGDASTDFIDQATPPNSVLASNPGVRPAFTASNAPAGMTTAVVFGSGYIITGAGVAPTAATRFGFATGVDFCIRGRFFIPNFALFAFTTTPIYEGRVASSDLSPVIYVSMGTGADADLMWYAGGTDRVHAVAAITSDIWHSFALARVGGVSRLFLDGVQQGTDFTDTFSYIGNFPLIGRFCDAGTDIWPGRISPLQVIRNPQTIAEGRYVANYTPEAVPYA